MDELQFRRKAYAEPNCQEPDFLQAMKNDAGKAATIDGLKALDDRIAKAMNVDVPERLTENLILRQQLKQHHTQKRKTGFMMAMAASVAFAAGVSFTLLRAAPVDLADHAIAHVIHESVALDMNQQVSYQQVNKQLVSLVNMQDSKFTKQPGDVYYTSYCDFQGVRSLHMVMQGDHGKVTLFIVPAEDRMKFEKSFSGDKYKGMGFEKDGAYMIMVGENQSDLNFVKKEIEGTFI
ncbi:MAG: DUF3379 domain-containing protein [Shewanella sp.]|nr:DUF3379 domain-containing protein [Shewanella sp.]